jgi:hypothetical protein
VTFTRANVVAVGVKVEFGTPACRSVLRVGGRPPGKEGCNRFTQCGAEKGLPKGGVPPCQLSSGIKSAELLFYYFITAGMVVERIGVRAMIEGSSAIYEADIGFIGFSMSVSVSFASKVES